jgi:hypothetical protein
MKTLLTIACISIGFLLGFSLSREASSPNSLECLEKHGIHRGGFDVKAAEGERLLYHMTGDLYEMRGGKWQPLEICGHD